jgi:hypothetical protein
LADTEQLHRKISQMGQRIRQLEDALAIFQSGVSTETHPLLQDHLLGVKFGPEVRTSDEPVPHRDPIAESVDAFGTLTIGDHGESKYFGPSGGSETLFLAGAELEIDNPEDQDQPNVSPEMTRLSAVFPFSVGCAGKSKSYDRALEILFSLLPPRPRAWSLCETYIEQASWMFRPLKRDEIIDDVLTSIYNAKKDRENPKSGATHDISPHKLAVMFMIFAQGALVDLTLPAYNAEAENYHHYARAALSLRPVFDSPAIETVQTIVLMATYRANTGKRYSLDSCWTLISLGAKLAQSIGLHRDPARWHMEPKIVERRRNLFWEIFACDHFHSLAFGRPPSIRLSYVDCELPEDDGRPESQFWVWKNNFSRKILASVIELTLTANTPSYDTILELDRKIREEPLPQALNGSMSKDDGYCPPSTYMRGCLLSQFRSITLLYIHRSFFAQAVLDHPVNPLRSRFAPSFLASYRCASVIIRQSMSTYERFPELCMRWWGMWTHLFSAAIIVGSIVTRAPSSSMSSTAFVELGLAVDLFEKGAKHSRRARTGIAILRKLRNKSNQVYSQFRGSGVPPTIHSPHNGDDGADELAIFGGQTRVIFSKLLISKSPNWDHTKIQPPSAEPVSLGNGDSVNLSDSVKFENTGVEEVHPSLMEYMALFPPTALPPDFTYPDINSQLPMSDQPMNGVSAFQRFDAPTEHADYSYPSMQLGYSSTQQPQGLAPGHPQSQHQSQHHQYPLVSPMASSASAASSPFPYNPSTLPFDAFHDAQAYAPTSPPSASTPESIGSSDHIADLGMMMNGDSAMDEQWMSFMRESGFMDRREGGGLGAVGV